MLVGLGVQERAELYTDILPNFSVFISRSSYRISGLRGYNCNVSVLSPGYLKEMGEVAFILSGLTLVKTPVEVIIFAKCCVPCQGK
jgi:hypothetical protein